MTKPLSALLQSGALWKGSAIESTSESAMSSARVEVLSFGVEAVDSCLPHHGLKQGLVHEFALENELTRKTKRIWFAPVALLATFVSNCTLDTCGVDRKNLKTSWIGRSCWPSPSLLKKTLGDDWQERCFFIDAGNKKERLWSTIENISSPAIHMTIADGEGLPFLATKQLAHVARRHNAIVIIVRPPWELSQRSAAYSKWLLTPIRSETDSTTYKLELKYIKAHILPSPWTLRHHHEENSFSILPSATTESNRSEKYSTGS